ncbi:hypothetical protein WMY93_023664 [Mugilogobius chulae]|uniref:RING-type domain-containing protein n=1 Tax=Mugilogobius chulae TaxID=88201 RepID=A0AAW0N602_9GOBI
MASKHEELFTCSICLQLLEDPVTIGCGHNYCMKCINAYWDRKSAEGVDCSCPQCRQVFTPRPTLFRNALLAELWEEELKSQDPEGAKSEDLDGEGGVPCDVCTGRTKRRACKFCLTCLVSYCQVHLNAHFEVPPLQKHTLVKASLKNKQVICVRHNKLLELYCRTDRLFICALCVVEDASSNNQRQDYGQSYGFRKKIIDLREAEKSIKGTAWEVCDEYERLCHENICLYICAMEKKCAAVRERVGEVEKAGLDWANTQLGHIRSEVNALKKMDQHLTELSFTEEPIQFIRGFQAIGGLPASNDVHTRKRKLTEFISTQNHKLKNVCNTEMRELHTNLSQYAGLSVPKGRNVQLRGNTFGLNIKG